MAAAAKKRNLVAYSHPESVVSEQFRMIQTNLKFLNMGEKRRVFLITSPSPEEGKSVTAANLAVTLALQKEKVLLIDANMRNPSLHTIFKIQNSIGLTDVLTGKALFEDTVYHTEIGRLDVLTSGTTHVNPNEVLGSSNMKALLKKALETYRLVLIDSYSVLDVTDTKLLANQCDAVVLVIQNGKTSFTRAVEAKKELQLAKANLVGVIMNEM
jgi:capsular exopolysaccharide synthesis family protein